MNKYLTIIMAACVFCGPLAAEEEYAPIGPVASLAEVADKMEEREAFEESFSQEAAADLPQVQGDVVILPIEVEIYEAYNHWAMYFSDNFRIVEIEDGSQWKVAKYDVGKTLYWLSGDYIGIYPNKSWVSSYEYKMVNFATGDSVDVNLKRGPLLDSPYTNYVAFVDGYKDKIFLTDGTIWKTSSSVYHWFAGDVVIIGFNDGWSSGSYPFILINVTLNEFVYVYAK